VRSFELNDLLEHRQRLLRRVPAALDAVIGIEHVDDAGDARLRRPAPRVARERDAPAGRAVVRAVPRQNLLPSRGQPRQLDGVLVRFGAAVGEEEHVDVARGDFGELRTQARARFGRHERVHVGQRGGLPLDRGDDARIAVAGVHAHQLAVEVDEALAFGRPEIHAFGARHRNRFDGPLRRPFEERVLLREGDHLLAGHPQPPASSL